MSDSGQARQTAVKLIRAEFVVGRSVAISSEAPVESLTSHRRVGPLHPPPASHNPLLRQSSIWFICRS